MHIVPADAPGAFQVETDLPDNSPLPTEIEPPKPSQSDTASKESLGESTEEGVARVLRMVDHLRRKKAQRLRSKGIAPREVVRRYLIVDQFEQHQAKLGQFLDTKY